MAWIKTKKKDMLQEEFDPLLHDQKSSRAALKKVVAYAPVNQAPRPKNGGSPPPKYKLPESTTKGARRKLQVTSAIPSPPRSPPIRRLDFVVPQNGRMDYADCINYDESATPLQRQKETLLAVRHDLIPLLTEKAIAALDKMSDVHLKPPPVVNIYQELKRKQPLRRDAESTQWCRSTFLRLAQEDFDACDRKKKEIEEDLFYTDPSVIAELDRMEKDAPEIFAAHAPEESPASLVSMDIEPQKQALLPLSQADTTDGESSPRLISKRAESLPVPKNLQLSKSQLAARPSVAHSPRPVSVVDQEMSDPLDLTQDEIPEEPLSPINPPPAARKSDSDPTPRKKLHQQLEFVNPSTLEMKKRQDTSSEAALDRPEAAVAKRRTIQEEETYSKECAAKEERRMAVSGNSASTRTVRGVDWDRDEEMHVKQIEKEEKRNKDWIESDTSLSEDDSYSVSEESEEEESTGEGGDDELLDCQAEEVKDTPIEEWKKSLKKMKASVEEIEDGLRAKLKKIDSYKKEDPKGYQKNERYIEHKRRWHEMNRGKIAELARISIVEDYLKHAARGEPVAIHPDYFVVMTLDQLSACTKFVRDAEKAFKSDAREFGCEKGSPEYEILEATHKKKISAWIAQNSRKFENLDRGATTDATDQPSISPAPSATPASSTNNNSNSEASARADDLTLTDKQKEEIMATVPTSLDDLESPVEGETTIWKFATFLKKFESASSEEVDIATRNLFKQAFSELSDFAAFNFKVQESGNSRLSRASNSTLARVVILAECDRAENEEQCFAAFRTFFGSSRSTSSCIPLDKHYIWPDCSYLYNIAELVRLCKFSTESPWSKLCSLLRKHTKSKLEPSVLEDYQDVLASQGVATKITSGKPKESTCEITWLPGGEGYNTPEEAANSSSTVNTLLLFTLTDDYHGDLVARFACHKASAKLVSALWYAYGLQQALGNDIIKSLCVAGLYKGDPDRDLEEKDEEKLAEGEKKKRPPCIEDHVRMNFGDNPTAIEKYFNLWKTSKQTLEGLLADEDTDLASFVNGARTVASFSQLALDAQKYLRILLGVADKDNGRADSHFRRAPFRHHVFLLWRQARRVAVYQTAERKYREKLAAAGGPDAHTLAHLRKMSDGVIALKDGILDTEPNTAAEKTAPDTNGKKKEKRKPEDEEKEDSGHKKQKSEKKDKKDKKHKKDKKDKKDKKHKKDKKKSSNKDDDDE